MSRRVVLPAVLAALLVPATAFGMGAAGAGQAKTTLPVIARQVMCVTCKIPLNVAESPQANLERAFIQRLINEGKNEAEIKQALVGEYGPKVLGLPAAKGFDLTVYLVPLAAVLALVGLFLTLLPRWRRAALEQASSAPQDSALPPSDAARLESDLARFD